MHCTLQNERLRNVIKGKTSGQGKGEELQKALSRISQLNKEKIVLTELSNRLRSELSKAGISLQKPVTARPMIHDASTAMKVDRAVRGKLDQLENVQYELMKANIAKSVPPPPIANSAKLTNNRRSASPPTRQEKRPASRGKSNPKPQHLPMFVEQSSTSGSSFKAKGKPVALQTFPSKPTKPYVAPPPRIKPSSNVAWVKGAGQRSGDKRANEPEEQESISSEAAVADPDSVIESPGPADRLRQLAVGFDSMELGSSIQDVWKLLDDHSSLNSATPD